MPSGKQTSFQSGEVAPSLRFRSDAASYSTGLSKLTNMYVRRAGGVSNRAGFQFVKVSESQENIPVPGENPGIKAFSYWDDKNKQWTVVEYGTFPTSLISGYSFVFNYQLFSILSYGNVIDDQKLEFPSPLHIRFTVLKDHIFITPQFRVRDVANSITYPNLYFDKLFNPPALYNFYGYDNYAAVTPAASSAAFQISGNSVGRPPFLAVTYILTGILDDGREVFLRKTDTGFTPDPNSLAPGNTVLPHGELTTDMNIIFGAGALPGVKFFNLYRAAGWESPGVLLSGFFSLAGKALYDGGTTTIRLTDYGVSDYSLTPPIDKFDFELFDTAKNASYYQQRLIMGLEANPFPLAPSLKTGDMLASKLGAPEQIVPPIIYSNNGAFQFSIPITDGTAVVAQLAMERLIAFTERGVYVIRGGDQGTLSPTSISPLLISEEGCSTTVEPAMSGRRGFFINNSHTKLMAIEFSIDGNLTVVEISAFSDHLLIEDVMQLVVLNGGGGDDSVCLLRRDGKITWVTVSGDIVGFSTVETDGYIESIYRAKGLRGYEPNLVASADRIKVVDVLGAYVIRSGHRILEQIVIRDDLHREGEFFADCFTSFGLRLSEYGNEGYLKANAPDSNNPRINIQTPISGIWTAGEPIDIWASHNNLYLGSIDNDGVFHFFYDDAQGNVQFLRYRKNGSSIFATGDVNFPHGFTGYFESDVPTYLQDAEAQIISLVEKKKRQRRWAPAVLGLGNAGLTNIKYAAFLDPLALGVQGDFSGAVTPNPSITNATGLSNIVAGSKLRVDGYVGPINVISIIGTTILTDRDFTHTESGSISIYVLAAVTVSGEGEVLSSPNNPYASTIYAEKEWSSEIGVTFPDYISYGYIGVPYTSEFETLDLETQDSRTLTDSKKLLNAVGVGFMETRGGFYGMPDQDLTNMEEIQDREDEDLSNQTKNVNGHLSINIPATWSKAGRINIKQVDPAPITILSVYPKGISGD